MDNIPPQHIPESANRFEILPNLSTDLVNHKTKNESVKESSEHESLQQRDFVQKRITDSEVVKYIGRTCLKKFQH